MGEDVAVGVGGWVGGGEEDRGGVEREGDEVLGGSVGEGRIDEEGEGGD